jgi:hypothetical protein
VMVGAPKFTAGLACTNGSAGESKPEKAAN